MWNYMLELLHMSIGVRRFIASEALLGVSIGIFAFVFNLHLLQIGLDEAEIGKITSLGTVVTGLFSIPSSLLANRLGRKKLLVCGLFLIGIGYAGIAAGEQIHTFYISQIVASIGITLLITSEIQLLFYYSRSKREETQAFSMLFAVFTLFSGIGTLIGGYIPQWLGGKTTIYQSSLFISSILVLITALIRWLLLPREETENKQIDNSYPLYQLTKQLKSRSIWIFSLLLFLTGVAYAFVIPFINVIVKLRFQISDEWISLLLTVNGIFLFVGSLITPYLLDRWGIAKTYFVIYVVNILLSFLLYFSIPVLIFAGLLLIRGGSFTMLSNVVESQTMQAIVEKERNAYAGIRVVFRSLGASMATYIAGLIMAQKNYALPFLLSGVTLFVSYLYFFIWVKPLFETNLQEKDSAAIETAS